MKIMTYNILDGGQERLETIVEVIKKESPDYLTINEANTFARKENKILKKVSKKISLPYCDIALSGQLDYHVAVFSKYPFKRIRKITPLMRACIVALVQTEFGLISIASLHLTPDSEDARLAEIDRILNYQKKYSRRILMGDMNSLSKQDTYGPKMIKNFNAIQLEKMTTNGKFRFDVINRIRSHGYCDAAAHLGKNAEPTVPTPMNTDPAHAHLRLDYIFVSKNLVCFLNQYGVIKNKYTKKASDHYPAVVELK